MSYRINKTNGDLVTELPDGQIDSTTTDITLIGRNYRGFGEIFNENFIKITENFASTASPDAPLKGQLWYDTNQQKLKIYNGSFFRAAGSPIVSSDRPSLVAGDLWIDNENRKLYFYDGNQEGDYTLVGPAYDNAQGKTGLEVTSVIDIGSQERIVIKVMIAGQLFAVISDSEFRLSGSRKITGYPDDPDDNVFPKRQLFENGFNLVSESSFYRGTASSARSLVDTAGNTVTTEDFVASNKNASINGSLTANNSNGFLVSVGDTVYSQYKVIGTTTVIETQQDKTDFSVRTRVGNQYTTPIYIDSSESNIGFFTTSPSHTLDVNGGLHASGDTVIDGNLTVNGNATYINVDTLRVLDKNIELGLLEDGTENNDAGVDGAGITIRSIDGAKYLAWQQSNNSWRSNVNFDLTAGNEYKINGNLVLSSTELGPTVNTASGLTSIGTLRELNVDNLTLDENTISSLSSLDINAAGDISVSNSKIKNLSEPAVSSDASTKSYVDRVIREQPVYFSLDTTQLDNPTLTNPYNDVMSILESLSPASEKEDDVRARIHCVSYNGSTITEIDVQSALTKQFVTIDAESVIQDISFSETNGVFDATPVRQTMTFQVLNGSWSWVDTV